MDSWTEGEVTTGSVPIHFYRTGVTDKPALILAHGFTDNGLCWARVVEKLKSSFNIVMVDARNHGQSGQGIGDSSDLVDDLASVIKHLGLEPAMAIGHSMGAGTVAGLAANYPELVARIVLEDPPWSENPGNESEESANKRREGFKQYLASIKEMSKEDILALGHKQHPRWHADDFPDWVQSNLQVGELALEGLKYSDWRLNIPKIQCPALLVYADGKRDGMLKQAVVDSILSENSNFEACHIPDAGHNVRRENFSAYVAAVSDFLSA